MIWSIRNLTAAGLVAASLVAAPALISPAAATTYDKTVRVIEVPGSQQLEVRRHPFQISRVVAYLPFNARGIKAFDYVRRRWTQVSFVASDGSRVTGWVRSANVADDDRHLPTFYELVGVGGYDEVPVYRRPNEGSRVIAEISGRTGDLRASGKCVNDFCLVKFRKGHRWIEGYVAQANLSVKRPDTDLSDGYGHGKPSLGDDYGNGNGYVDDQYSDGGNSQHYPKKPAWLKEYRDIDANQ